MRICPKVFVSGDEVGEETVLAITDHTWLRGREGKSGREKGDE